MTSLTTMSPHDSHDIITELWAQLSIQLALCCSSGHYGGRSLQIFRALRVSISSRILTDIPSQLVQTIADQGGQEQGFVTELILTLKAVVDTRQSLPQKGILLQHVAPAPMPQRDQPVARPWRAIRQGGHKHQY